jgi:HAE1 family hydrophobic/amphiphilic exporter-1
LYQQFSLTIAFAIAISAFNSLTFTPSLSALLLRPERSHEQKNILFRAIETAIRKGTSLYSASARGAIRVHYIVLVVFFLGLAAT